MPSETEMAIHAAAEELVTACRKSPSLLPVVMQRRDAVAQRARLILRLAFAVEAVRA